MTGTLHEDQYTFFNHISSNSTYNEKCSRQKLYKKSKHIYVQYFSFFENRAVYEIMWKNTVEPGRPQMTI